MRFDNTVTWLASWTENIQNTLKYIMLNPSSKLKVGMMLLFRQSCCFLDYWLFARWKDQGKAEMWHRSKMWFSLPLALPGKKKKRGGTLN